MRLAGSFFCLVAVALAGRDDNLAKNGGFEKGLSSWEIVNNSGGLKADVVGKRAKRGKRALHVEKNGRFALDYVGQKIKQVPAGGRISVSLYVRGEGLRNSWIKFHVFDKRGNDLIEDVDLTQLRGSFGWKKIEREFTLPADAASVEIRAAMFLNGELWLDEVEVKTLEKGGRGQKKKRRALPTETRRWLDEHAFAVNTVEAGAPAQDLAPLREIVNNKRIVLLGENTHGDGTCFAAKARLARYLHESCGFEVIAFESGLFECDRANALVAKGGDMEEAMRASIFGIWCVEEVRPLFDYMAKAAKTRRPFILAGFDTRGSGKLAAEFLPNLYEILEPAAKVAKKDREALAEMDGLLNAGGYKPPAKVRDAGTAALKRLRATLDGARQELVGKHGPEQVEFYSHCLDNYVLRERFEHSKNDTKGRWHSTNIRDEQMGRNLRWLAETRFPGKKIVCWGATFHLMRGADAIKGGSVSYAGCKPMGQHVRDHFGDQAYVVGFAAYRGRAGMPWNQKFSLKKPRPGSIEDLLFRYGRPYLFVDLTAPGPLAKPNHLAVLGYDRTFKAPWPKLIDGLFFCEEMEPPGFLKK